MSLAHPQSPAQPSPDSPSLHTDSISRSSSPIMSPPPSHEHDSTMLTTFDSSITPPDSARSPADRHDKLAASAPAQPSCSSAPLSRVASAGFPPASTKPPAIGNESSALRATEHGVSPVINALRSPYPASPSYFVTAIPPEDFPTSSESTNAERNRLQRGSLLPLYPTLGGQLWAISREFALPSVGGLLLFLADDGQGNRGPRIGDAAWQALWSRYFADDDLSSTSAAHKPPPNFAHSRRSSDAAADSFAHPSSSSSAHAADLSRSTVGEASSSRPTIPYYRPSPRVDALGFGRRDAHTDWSPSVRSAAAFSAGHHQANPPPPPPFPSLPIVARIEWQVDTAKAPWWPSWIASRANPRERPSHPTRKSMHLAHSLSQSQDDEPQHESDRAFAQDLAPTFEAEIEQPVQPKVQQRSPSTASNHQAESVREAIAQREAASDAGVKAAPLEEAALHDDGLQLFQQRFSQSSTTAPLLDEEPQSESQQTQQAQDAPLPTLPTRSASPSDEPVQSQRASIVSMSSAASASRPALSVSRASIQSRPVLPAPTTSSSSSHEVQQASSQHQLTRDALMPSHRSNSGQSRTGYSEILDAADDAETEHDISFGNEPLAHAGDYSALPDSPSSAAHEITASQRGSTYEPKGFALRHSFIVDAGDEAMWQHLQHHDIDPILPEPGETSNAAPSFEHQQIPAAFDDNPRDFDTLHASALEAAMALPPQQPMQQVPTQHYASDAANDVYYSPRRDNMARIQSWIGKTPTGRPNSSGAFDDDFANDFGHGEMQLPPESDIDEVVGLWASKIRQDPYAVPHITGPSPSVHADDDAAQAVVRSSDEPHFHIPSAEAHESDASLEAAPPAISLLSPIHLDAAAFGGVKPQLGGLTASLSPQLLSPTAVGDAFNTPRAPPSPRSVSTPIFQHHPPSSPGSLALPQDRRPSSVSRRSSGDLSDSLEDMQKALELLSPGCSPNPGGGNSPDPAGRKMSSRDSLAYARSLSASVTPSPKWIARAKAATAKSRSNARSPFDRAPVSPRPASTSAVSASRFQSPRIGMHAPLSASRLVEFSKADAVPRLARTEVADTESMRSRDSVPEAAAGATSAGAEDTPTVTEDAPESKPVAALSLDADAAQEHADAAQEHADAAQEHTESIQAGTPKASHQALEDVESSAAEEAAEAAAAAPVSAVVAERAIDAPEAGSVAAPDHDGDDTTELSAFLGDDHDDGIASIQRFLRGKVVSAAESDASITQDLTVSGVEQPQTSSADGTIIERTVSIDSDMDSVPQPSAPSEHADAADAADVIDKEHEHDEHAEIQATQDDAISNERWSQVSYATGKHTSQIPSRVSLPSASSRRDEHPEARTPNFTYDALLSSEPTTADTLLSSTSRGDERLSAASDVVKAYLSSSPSDEAFFKSPGPSKLESADASGLGQGAASALPQPMWQQDSAASDAAWPHIDQVPEVKDETSQGGVVPVLAYRLASSPVHASPFGMSRPLAGTHDYSLDEEEIRTMNEDTRAAVREALSQSTSHHVNLPASVSAPLSPKSSTSPTLSSHSSLGDQFRRRGSTSSLNLTSAGAGSGSNTSSPNLGGTTKRRPARLNLDIDGLARSPPAAASRRLPSTSPRSRFGQLPPSPSLHPSYKAATSSPLSTSFPIMGAHLGSPQGKHFLPSLPSVTSIEAELAG
ncbi:uncharacterized protein PAN0_033c6259 [Moesziomyces antarcticus]|nr:uncharacterized protein PAN0_045d6394 [Moesziomyces antarcticus]XP_014653764.1 uncharacterized protein PAN0_033c6259 [Moesziomyces antarcticus]GAK68029.1 conserved hypothetical protein [Moesziomyces antarcticus]GAK68159.1 conserved hypothetical protein [Moesziomyces antarcticus]